MNIIRAGDPFPEQWDKSLFLALPDPPRALEGLSDQGYDGVVFVSGPAAPADWEDQALHFADVIVLWQPPPLVFGSWVASHKAVYGRPPGHDASTQDLDARWQATVGQPPHETLAECLRAAVAKLGEGALRRGGERHIPLHLWRTPLFQSWHENLTRVGNRLDQARVRWVFFLPQIDKLLAAVLWVDVWVQAEGRHKSNEWIFSRSDISCVVLFEAPESRRTRSLEAMLDRDVVLVREFRSPARTADGFVHELPGGSSVKPGADPRQVAAAEAREEAGLDLPAERFFPLGSRQLAGTLSTHHAHVFAAALTPVEMRQAREMAAQGRVHGNASETERTVVEITSPRQLLSDRLVDWATVGMVMQALHDWRAHRHNCG